MTSRCGVSPLWRREARCMTPKRCCSSTTASPRRGRSAFCCSSACVPTTMSSAPCDIMAWISRFCLAGWLPSSRPSDTGRGSEGSSKVSRASPSADEPAPLTSSAMLRKCCSARISVGAMNAPCRSFATADSRAASATTVLPLPTSPWSRRLIGRSPSMSDRISSRAFPWADVSENGRREVRASSTPWSRLRGGAPPDSRHSLRREKTNICMMNSSSKARRRRAMSWLSGSCG